MRFTFNNQYTLAPSPDNPAIRQEFVTAAFRYGHAQVDDKLDFRNSNLGSSETRNMKDNYFDPDGVFKHGPGGCLRGAMMQKTNTVSGTYADSTQHNLFKPADFEHGVDLLSINLAVSFLLSHAEINQIYSAVVIMVLGLMKR